MKEKIIKWFIKNKIYGSILLILVLIILAFSINLIFSNPSIENIKEKHSQMDNHIATEILKDSKKVANEKTGSKSFNVNGDFKGNVEINYPSNSKEKPTESFNINIAGKLVNKETKEIIEGASLYLPDYTQIGREFSNKYGEFKFISEKNDKEKYIRIIIEHSKYITKKQSVKIANKHIYIEMTEKNKK